MMKINRRFFFMLLEGGCEVTKWRGYVYSGRKEKGHVSR
jgi:hypothetical protein